MTKGWVFGRIFGVGLHYCVHPSLLIWPSWSQRSLGEGCLDQDSGRGGSWSPRFTRSFNDWEMDEVMGLLLRLCCQKVILEKEDRVRRMETKDGVFSTKSLYKALEPGSSLFPMKIIWKSCVHPKVTFFAWEASWALANRCYFCQADEESIDHLLHCENIRALWEMLFTFVGVSWVFPSSVRETLLGWNGFFVGKKRKTVWREGPPCIFWIVWKTRNNIAFEDDMLSIQRLKTSFLNSLWLETKLFIRDCPSTFLEFFDWVGSD